MTSSLLSLGACVNPGTRTTIVVQEPIHEVSAARLKSGLRVWDRSCDTDPAFDSGCALGSLPIYELPYCTDPVSAALPVMDLPADATPSDCSVQVRSVGRIPFTFDPAWRSTCIRRDDGTYQCSGVPVVASLTPDEEVNPPSGVQAILTLSCIDYQDVSTPLVMSRQSPLPTVYAGPNCR